jgi:hypothetical protein
MRYEIENLKKNLQEEKQVQTHRIFYGRKRSSGRN